MIYTFLYDFIHEMKEMLFNPSERFILDCLMSGISQVKIGIFLDMHPEVVIYHKREIFKTLRGSLNILILEYRGFDLANYVKPDYAATFKMIQHRKLNNDMAKESNLEYQVMERRVLSGYRRIKLDNLSVAYLINLVSIFYCRRVSRVLASRLIDWFLLDIRQGILQSYEKK